MMSRKGQVSMEMLLILVVALAIVMIVASQLISNANKASQKAEESTDVILDKLDQAVKGDVGDYCKIDEDCKSNTCISNECQ